MSVLLASSGLAALAGYANPNVSTDLSSFAVDYWPAHQADMGGGQPGYALSRVVAAAHPVARTAQAGTAYADDYYYRVHLRPDVLALGNLGTSQNRSVEVWNAWLDVTLTLDAVASNNAGGIVITPPAALPVTFAPLQSRIWQIGVSLSGPASIDASVQWQFADSTQDAWLTITGQRMAAWSLVPDWATGINETLEWLTDMQEAVGGAQDRTPARDAPRRSWEFPVIVQGQDRQIMEALLFDASARTFVLPVWPDISLLSDPLAAGSTAIALDTHDLDFAVGAQAMLWGSATQYELVEVGAITSDSITLAHATINTWPAGTRIYPCRVAALTDYPQLSRLNDRLATTTVRFRADEPCDWPALAPTAAYLDIPVLEQRTDEPQDLAAAFTRKATIIDDDVGPQQVDDISGLAWPTQQHYWLLNGRAQRGAFRSLLYWLQGRANALWLPTWQDDLTLAADIAAPDSSISVVWAGVTHSLQQQPGRRHIRIELYDGSVLYRRITGAQDNGASERLALDSAPGVAIAATDIRQINWMMLATLAGDSVQLAHVTDSMGIATSVATFAGVPAEEP